MGAVRGRGVLVGRGALGVGGRGFGVGGHDGRAVVDGALVLVVSVALRVGGARLERHGGGGVEGEDVVRDGEVREVEGEEEDEEEETAVSGYSSRVCW